MVIRQFTPLINEILGASLLNQVANYDAASGSDYMALGCVDVYFNFCFTFKLVLYLISLLIQL